MTMAVGSAFLFLQLFHPKKEKKYLNLENETIDTAKKIVQPIYH